MLQFLQGLPELFSLSRSSGSSNTGLLVKFCLVNGDRQLISNALQQFNFITSPWVEGIAMVQQISPSLPERI